MISQNNTGASAAPEKQELPVPTSALEIEGTAPADGDEVEFTVKGIAGRSENGCTYVKPTEVNGQPIPDAAGGEMSDDDMMRQAEAADSGDNPDKNY